MTRKVQPLATSLGGGEDSGMGCRSAAVTTGEIIAKLDSRARLQMERSHNLRGIAGGALVHTACQPKPLRLDTFPETVFCLREIPKRIRTSAGPSNLPRPNSSPVGSTINNVA